MPFHLICLCCTTFLNNKTVTIIADKKATDFIFEKQTAISKSTARCPIKCYLKTLYSIFMCLGARKAAIL